MNNNNRAPIPMNPIDDHKPIGALVGSIVVIIILILAVIYLWITRIQPRIKQNQESTTQENSETALMSSDNTIIELSTQGTSDEVEDIEKDLKATDLNNLDKEIKTL